MVHNLGEQNSLLNQFVLELRDKNIQQDSMRFRRNLERIGEVIAYEISKTFTYKNTEVQTPLGVADVSTFTDTPVLATILRAGLPMHQGFLNYFDRGENAFISAFRKYHKDGNFEIKFEHLSCPEIDGKQLIIVDPMLASGGSMVVTYKALLEKGTPKHTHIVAAIGSKDGLEYVKRNLNTENITFWFAAIDPELTTKSYIVPGLGDAGDLAFGSKM